MLRFMRFSMLPSRRNCKAGQAQVIALQHEPFDAHHVFAGNRTQPGQ